jgi:hypothetical protein
MPRYVLGVFAFASMLVHRRFAQDGHRGQVTPNITTGTSSETAGRRFLCCNGTTNGVEGDCRPTRAYLNDDGSWYAFLDGRWVPVPPASS